MGVPKPIQVLDPKVGALTDTDLFPSRSPIAPPAQKTTMLQLAQYIASKLTANNGLSKDLLTGLITQLGQAVGRAGDPAALINDIEIPNVGGFTIFIGKNDGLSNVIGLNSDNGISLANNTGQGYQAFWDGLVPLRTSGIQIESGTGLDVTIVFSTNADGRLTYDGDGLHRFHVDKPFQFLGYGSNIGKILSAINPAHNVTVDDSTILYDTTGGNATVNLNPVLLANLKGNVKKISADVNTVTLHAVSGSIFGLGAGVTDYVFNVQGQSVGYHSDGTDIYLI